MFTENIMNSERIWQHDLHDDGVRGTLDGEHGVKSQEFTCFILNHVFCYQLR